MLRLGDYIRDLRLAKWVSGVSLHGSNPEPPMIKMSAFVPIADICGAAKFRLFDHLVGAGEHLRWDGDTERLGGPEVND
jgi:hypothetical protein